MWWEKGRILMCLVCLLGLAISISAEVVFETEHFAVRVDNTGAVKGLLDRRNGAESWKNNQLLHRGLTRPVFYGSFIVVGDADGYLHWINISNGQFAAREKVGGKGFSGPPLVVGNTLYVMTKKGELVAYRAGAALN